MSFPFDAQFQRSLVRLAQIDEGFNARAVELVDPGHFTTEALTWMWTRMVAYSREWGRRCTDVVLRDLARREPLDRAPRYQGEVEAVAARADVPEGPYVRSVLSEWLRRQIFIVAHRETTELFNAGRDVEAYDVMARAQDRIRQVGFEDVDRQWFFDELPSRQKERYAKSLDPTHDVFPTGIDELDDATDGGVHLGELWAFFAYAKMCKTTWLINQGFRSVRATRQPVLHVILEGRGSQIAAKYDACFANHPYKQVRRGDIDPVVLQALYEEYETLRGLLVIRTLNDWDVSVNHVRAELLECKARGFKPKMLIVDYMDLLRSRDGADNETGHQVAAAHDLKRLVEQEDLAGWSAWQARRPKEGSQDREHVLTSADVADAYAKVRIVDAYGSLNATDAEMAAGQMRLHVEGHRDAPVGKTWLITNELDRMRMATSVIAKPVKVAQPAVPPLPKGAA